MAPLGSDSHRKHMSVTFDQPSRTRLERSASRPEDGQKSVYLEQGLPLRYTLRQIIHVGNTLKVNLGWQKANLGQDTSPQGICEACPALLLKQRLEWKARTQQITTGRGIW